MHTLYVLLLLFTSVTCYKDCFKKLPLPKSGNAVAATILSSSSEIKFIFSTSRTIGTMDLRLTKEGYLFTNVSLKKSQQTTNDQKLVFAWIPELKAGDNSSELQVYFKSSLTEMQLKNSYQDTYEVFKTDIIIQDYDLMTSEDSSVEPTFIVAGRGKRNGEHVINMYKLDRKNAPTVYHTISSPRTNGYLGNSKVIGGHFNSVNSFVGLLYNNTIHVYNCTKSKNTSCTETLITISRSMGEIDMQSFYVFCDKVENIMVTFSARVQGEENSQVHMYRCTGPRCFQANHGISIQPYKIRTFYANKQIYHFTEYFDEYDGPTKMVFSCSDVYCKETVNTYQFPALKDDDLIWGPDPLWGFGTASDQDDKTVIPYMIIPDAEAGFIVPLCNVTEPAVLNKRF